MEAEHHFPILLPLFESGLFLFRDILSCAKFFLLLGTHLFGLNAFETGVVFLGNMHFYAFECSPVAS